MTKTGAVFSCIQVRKLPKTREAVPESPVAPTPEKPFSISSTHRTAGAAASADRIAVRRLDSLEPTTPENTLPMSMRSRGRRHEAATALAVRDLPQPGTPVMSTPRGAGIPYSAASASQELSRRRNQRLRLSRPPTPVRSILVSTYSSSPLLRTACFFSCSTVFTSSALRTPSEAMARASAPSASVSVRPREARTRRSLSISVRSIRRRLFPALAAMRLSRIRRIAVSSGSGKSRMWTSFSSSGGILRAGATIMSVRARGPFWKSAASSRSLRTIAGSAGRAPSPRWA